MSEPLKLPEKVRARLAELHRISQQAQREFGLSAGVALEFLGLDPAAKCDINFDTGVVTAQAAPDEPTPIRADVAQVEEPPNARMGRNGG